MPSRSTLALAAAAASTANAFTGFNYGNTFTDGSIKAQSDFEAEFRTAANLAGTDGAFTSARLYTMIQGGTANNPIAAIPAAISTGTSLLLGMWASAGQEAFNNELAALQNTIDQYCGQLDGLVAGISVGSEDLYRITPTGIANGENPGAGPDVLTNYINEVRDKIQGTCLSDAPIGHVDTWTAWVNGSNSAVIEACDWLGMDAYPYFETTKSNAIASGAGLFQDALGVTRNAAAGKDVWITETGWPVSGDESGQAIASTNNARTYWTDVGCPLFGSVNVWWYTLQDSAPDTPNPSFGVIGSELTETPLYDLSCSGGDGNDDSSETTTGPINHAGPTTVASTDAPATSTDDNDGNGDAQSNTDDSSSPTATATGDQGDAAPVTSVIDIPESSVTDIIGSIISSISTDLVDTTMSTSASSSTGASSPDSSSTPADTPSGTPTDGSSGGAGDTGAAGGAAPTESNPPSSGNRFNSFGAAAAAIIVAVALV
jgi:glucan endo-1,3-beta-D-glucosidase